MLVAELGIGAVLGASFVVAVRSVARPVELYVYAAGLVLAALIYVVFAVLSGSGAWLLVELVGVLLFAAIAALGLGTAPVVVGVGWGLHIAWDAWLHGFAAQGLAPAWYPGLCAGFDFALAAYIVQAFRGRVAPGFPSARRAV